MAELITPDNAVSIQQQSPMRSWRLATLSLYWFASSAHWSAIMITLLPLQAEVIGGNAEKGKTLATIVLLGAFVSMLVAPIFGAWSDRVRTRWGRRKPFLVAGAIGNIVGLIALAQLSGAHTSLLPYILWFMWVEFFNNLATAPYSALIPDVVPQAQRGTASGWMGLMTMLGNFVGGTIGLVLTHIGGASGAYYCIAGLILLGMLCTVLTVQEPEPPKVPPFRWGEFVRGFADAFRSRDFTWVFLTRFLVVLGTFTVQEYLLYYMKDVVAGGVADFAYRFFGITLATSAVKAMPFFMMALLSGAVISSLFAGMLSDRYGRKRMVYLSGGLQALVAMVFIISGRFDVAVLMGVVFGLGYGAYNAVDWALASDVLPSKEDHAKDMGVWHIASSLPQVVATPIAGLLLDHFQRVGKAHGQPTLGYTVIFLLAFVYFALGTVLVKQVKGTR